MVAIALFFGACGANKWRYSPAELGLSYQGVSAEESSGSSTIGQPMPTEAGVGPVPVTQDVDEATEAEKPNRAAIFLAGAFEDSESGFVIGADYEYLVRETLGLGGLIEHATGDFDTTTIAAVVFLHPHREWKILIGAGNEHRDGDNDFLLRIGGEHEFFLQNDLSIAPGVFVDFVGGDQRFIVGVDIGIAF